MHTPQSQEIVARFYEAIRHLMNNGELRSMREFTEKYGILYSNFHKAMTNNACQIFQIGWATPIISDFGISAHWLMTGKGEMVFKSSPDSAQRIAQESKKARNRISKIRNGAKLVQ